MLGASVEFACTGEQCWRERQPARREKSSTQSIPEAARHVNQKVRSIEGAMVPQMKGGWAEINFELRFWGIVGSSHFPRPPRCDAQHRVFRHIMES